MLDLPTIQVDPLAFRIIASSGVDHPILNTFDRIKRERYHLGKSANLQRYRTSLELVRESWYSPFYAGILADYLEDQDVYAEWSPILRGRPTVLRLMLSLQFCGARARHYLGTFRTALNQISYERAMERTKAEREQFLQGVRPSDEAEDQAEVYGYPWNADCTLRYLPQDGLQWEFRRWPQHVSRLLYAGLDGYRIPSDCGDDLSRIISRVSHDFDKYKYLPWWGFKL